MSLILTPTHAGMDRENTALANGEPLPKVARVVVGTGLPHTDPATATALVAPRAQSVQLAITRLSDTAIQINAGIDKTGAYAITEVGLELADGTLYAYGTLMPPAGFFKGEGIALELPCVLSRSNLGQLTVDWNILDVNALAENIKNLALDAFTGEAAPIVTELLSPLEQAVRYSWEDGIQRFEMELFSPRFTLRDSAPIAISGVVAGDDSLDLAEHTDTLTSGDYVIFNASHAEPVRILANLELGRRRVVNNLQYTYPNATLARSNWTIHAGEAVCQAGGVYFARRLRLVEGDVHRVYIRALTAAGAPQLAWRADGGEFATAPLVSQRLVDSTWTDYGFDVPAGEYFYLRVQTPLATRIKSMVACNTLHEVRVLTAPVIVGQQAVPGQPVSLLASAQSRLVGGSIARFDVSCDGVLRQWPASNNNAVITLTFQGTVGDTRSLVLTAVDDLGNRSTPTLHTVTLADNITPPAPSITNPAAGATGVGLTPQLSASAFVVANATHANTDWQIRAADGQTVVWQSLNNTNQLTSITVPANTLSANTGYQAWVRYRTGSGAVTAWGSAGFTTLAVPAALAGEMSWTTPGNYTWTVPDGVTAGSALVVDGSGGDVGFGALTITGSGFEAVAVALPTIASWQSVAYGNGLFVAVAYDSSIAATSPDGMSWTQQTLPKHAYWQSVIYGNGKFVAIANGSNVAAISSDGAIWVEQTLPGAGYSWQSVVYGNGLFLAVAFSANFVATSPDGVTWTLRTLPATTGWASAAYGNGIFVVLSGSNGMVATSTDGLNWTQHPLPVSSIWNSVTYGNGSFVAVSEAGIAATSQDGLVWTQRAMPSTAAWRAIAYGNGVFFAVATINSIAATSFDGATWHQHLMPGIAGWNALTFGHATFVAVTQGASAASLLTGNVATHADATLTSTTGFSLTAPTSAGSYGVSSGVAAYDNDMPLTPGAQITVTVPAPDGAVRVIWGAGRSFPNNAASAGTQIGIVLVAEGGGAGQWQRVDGNFNPVNYPFGGAFFNSHPTYAGIVDQTIDGQAMVKVPKFWFKTGNVPSGQYAGKRYWMISDQAAPGFAVHPAFMNYGVEVAQYWLGKYQGTADGGKLGSQTGLMPLTSLDFPTMQARAVARNVSGVSGFMMWSIYQLAAVQMLCLIEMGSSDSQTVIGAGNVSGSNVLSVNNPVVATATWRGIVGLWGNIWQMLDGLRTNSLMYNIWHRDGGRNFTGTSQSRHVNGYTSGFITQFSTMSGVDYDLSAVFVASGLNGTPGSGSYADDWHSSSSSSVAAFGGGADDISNTDLGLSRARKGVFATDVGLGADTVSSTLGSRLAKY